MNCRMILDLYYVDGPHIEKELTYYGDGPTEVGEDIDRDTNELAEYMRTFDDKGVISFCFGGFSFLKRGLIAASLTEPDF